MNRVEFMNQLESLLQSISSTEREEAVQYYNDYFDDAGAENEQQVIEALGNPARVAENIKRDLSANGYGETSARKVKASDRVLMEYGKSSPDEGEEPEAPESSGGERTGHGGAGTGADGGAGSRPGSGYGNFGSGSGSRSGSGYGASDSGSGSGYGNFGSGSGNQSGSGYGNVGNGAGSQSRSGYDKFGSGSGNQSGSGYGNVGNGAGSQSRSGYDNIGSGSGSTSGNQTGSRYGSSASGTDSAFQSRETTGYGTAGEGSQGDPFAGYGSGSQYTAGSGTGSWSQGASYQSGYTSEAPRKKENMPVWAFAMLVTILVITSPLWIGVAFSVLGVVFGGLVAWFGMIFGAGLTALILLLVMVILVAVGIMCFFSNPWVGMAVAGGGLVCGCIGMLFLMLTVAMAGIATPAIFRGIAFVCRGLRRKRTVAQGV